MNNKVVLRFIDGRLVKGTTADFLPAKDRFHVRLAGAPADAAPIEIHTSELKALFFVKDFAGQPGRPKRNEFDPAHPEGGRRIRVVFNDGEILLGTTAGYQPGRPGFFVVPADPDSNNERCFVFTAATREVAFV
jgi:hypothetical protein